MNRRSFLTETLATTALAATATPAVAGSGLVRVTVNRTGLPSRTDVLAQCRLVNDRWMSTNPVPAAATWDAATYYSGAMAYWRASADTTALAYTRAWAESHNYQLVGGPTTRNADNQCAGQVYMDLYMAEGGPSSKIDCIGRSLKAMRDSGTWVDWSWVDAMHMSMPAFARYGFLRRDPSYWVYMYRLYHNCKRLTPDAQHFATGLGDEATGLYFRDNTYAIYGAAHFSPNGKPVLWSRGNGWAAAALAKTLGTMPATDPRAGEYAYSLQSLAAALLPRQRPDGFWNTSLADPDQFGGPETSGTALFTFALAYGIRAGLLDAATYLPVVTAAWNGMNSTAVDGAGRLGYVQGIGGGPAAFDPSNTTNFGVGAFLLAGGAVAAVTN